MYLASVNFSALLVLALILYSYTSLCVFRAVNSTIKTVVDEKFHVPQGIEYCKGNFSAWDPKITTLPGLYYTTSFFGPLGVECNTYSLRFANVLISLGNFAFIVFLLRFIYINNNKSPKVILQALSLATLPPLYFFSFVYYTDTLALFTLLAYTTTAVIFKNKWLVVATGICSIYARQTNIVWVAMMFGHKLMEIFIRSSRVYGNQYLNKTAIKRSIIANTVDTSKLKRYYSFNDFIFAFKFHIRSFFTNVFQLITFDDYIVLSQQAILLIGFLLFLIINGSIVVGDKSAHQATLHLPQLLYFLLFYGMFGLAYVLGKLKSTIELILRNKLKAVLMGLIFLAIVHFNTLVHPYLLADNRHYTFYVWNRWFGRYDYAKYATVPAYVFLLFSLYDNLKDQNCVTFLLPYTVSLFICLALQQLVDLRYFLIPYIIIRLRFGKSSYKVAVFEFLWYLFINLFTFCIFFNKEIQWQEYDEPQRIIW